MGGGHGSGSGHSNKQPLSELAGVAHASAGLRHVRLLGKPSFAEAEIRLDNRGDGDALPVRLDRVTLATGWELLSQRAGNAPLPEPLEIGRIGAGGTGLLLLRLCRRRGEAPPAVTVKGTYAGAMGVVRELASEGSTPFPGSALRLLAAVAVYGPVVAETAPLQGEAK